MRLFISYARVDKPYCIQIVDTLYVHDTWYDQRLHAGQDWWKEITLRIEWCDGFVYLLSPESVTSEYCIKEYELARSLNKHIFPVLIHKATNIPKELQELQYADLSEGLTGEAVTTLLNSIYMAEHTLSKSDSGGGGMHITPDMLTPPRVNLDAAITKAVTAMGNKQFDNAVFLLKQAKAQGFKSKFTDIDAVLREAEAGLERQTFLREAEREYQHIRALMNFEGTQDLGCQALKNFARAFPNYDPDKLMQKCGQTRELPPVQVKVAGRASSPGTGGLPLLEWCEIPAGRVTYAGEGKTRTLGIDSFYIAKYPVTNAQYQIFVNHPNGYSNPKWWTFSEHARKWFAENPKAIANTYPGDELPRERVNWFAAMAFCNWLSAQTGEEITLPTDAQWRRAAQGDSNCLYTWGNEFDTNKANTSENGLKITTLVTRYAEGVSPFGVYDMIGNVWEWCLNTRLGHRDGTDLTSDEKRIVHGGSHISPADRCTIPFNYVLNPLVYHTSIGFRIVCVTPQR
jgi:formylglycine-generating enzyme required for sulfatase activity